ncbi:hypothetical protein QJS04_geneDACA019855 [Acorus gramineus]|uniref:Uncharacterized protein n=1 Tax=Acorus gramineus TaxID=55184 RepID=A0AAV9BXR1_ACOGR|nr:hypothetical protein QJS04_geneDACA019855 [Acorus gramineus]
MDLNASPLPEEDEETFEQPVENDFSREEYVEHAEERVESSVQIHHVLLTIKEREERRKRMRECQDEPPRQVAVPPHRGSMFQMRSSRSNEKRRLPQGQG